MTSSALAGKRIVNTRAAHQSAELDALIVARGAQSLPYPCIAIAAPDDTSQLDAALRSAVHGEFDWLVLTSANTVRIVQDRFRSLGISLPAAPPPAIAAIGPATGEAVKTLLSAEVALMPGEYVAEELAEALKRASGRRILLPQAAIARPVLTEQLRAAGMDVTPIAAYQTVIGSGGVDMPELLATGQVDAIVFTSPSTARNFVARLDAEGGNPAHLEGVCIASIGPVTEKAVAELGLTNTVMPEEHTLPGVLAALESFFSQG